MLWNLVAWETGNRYTLLLMCANFGDIHLYLICTILGKFQFYGGAERRLNVGAFLRFFAIGAFQKCAVYFYPLRENKGLVHE
jgi:hypothetical protein